MNFDFSALLVLLTVASGLIWAVDAWLFAPGRRTALELDAADEDSEEQQPLLVEYARSFFPVFLIVLLLRSFLVEPFRIPSASMMPTLEIGDFILVNKYHYGIRLPVLNTKVMSLQEPDYGDIVVFRYPKDTSTPYIKRVVGLPGDRVTYLGKQLFINDKMVPAEETGRYESNGAGRGMNGIKLLSENLLGVEHHILHDPARPGMRIDRVVPAGHYFVMGDNRDHSSDSRFWGFVPDENLIGRAFMIWMNWDAGIHWSRLGLLQ